jgi:AcrR family transcriptional regulator
MARLTREQSQALTREKLLRAASEVVARNGYEGASVERIAEEAGFTKGAFYSNFSSKEEILLHLLEENAGNDVGELTSLLDGVTDPDAVIETVARWSDSRANELKLGVLAIEFLRRARREDTLDGRRRHIFISQWQGVGALLLDKIFPGRKPDISALDFGGIVLELTYGGITSFLGANTAGQMVRHVLRAFRDSGGSGRETVERSDIS